MWLFLAFKTCLAFGTWLCQKEMLIPLFIAAITALHHMNRQPFLSLFYQKASVLFSFMSHVAQTPKCGAQFLCTNQLAIKTPLGDGYK